MGASRCLDLWPEKIMTALTQYSSRRQMKRAFREGKGVYEDGQSSFSVNCQNARSRGRRPMTEAVRIVRQISRC